MNENNTYTVTKMTGTEYAGKNDKIVLTKETKIRKVCAGFYELRLSNDTADRFEITLTEENEWFVYWPHCQFADAVCTTLREAKLTVYESDVYAAHIARVQS